MECFVKISAKEIEQMKLSEIRKQKEHFESSLWATSFCDSV